MIHQGYVANRDIIKRSRLSSESFERNPEISYCTKIGTGETLFFAKGALCGNEREMESENTASNERGCSKREDTSRASLEMGYDPNFTAPQQQQQQQQQQIAILVVRAVLLLTHWQSWKHSVMLQQHIIQIVQDLVNL